MARETTEQLHLRLPADVKRQLAERAADEQTSQSKLAAAAITLFLANLLRTEQELDQ